MKRIHFLVLITALVIGGFHVAAEEKPVAIAGSSNMPPIQMLMPGFTVRELPLHLNNLNSLVYAPDGRLFALAYNGNVWQLKDTDGDGLEDTATLFYKSESNSIPPSIGMAWGPGGLYIASKNRIIRLKDQGDGTGKLETITGGWQQMAFPAGSGLDAVGIAVGADGSIYFGLGCDAWANEYLVDTNTDKSRYNIDSVRGTIQKISPDWQRRETLATGVRFTVCLAINGAGDLFCTDQEGATWLPNGNPFDELLHIQKGRHYGFPPRHPKYLPNVIDEPSTFDYAPQHQSTCGFHFNEPVAGSDKTFGPDWWRGDAIVTGESRGKLWHTKLVKTAAGYVAQNYLFAALTMLTVDAVPTPQGDLIVNCHSGSPDWGTGPEGKGKLFKISYTDKKAPQPALAYAASYTETRVFFDSPLDAVKWKNLAAQSLMTAGKYVAAADRLESFHPGYEVINYQKAHPGVDYKVLSAGITPDNHEIVLQTVPRIDAVNYAIKLPGGTAETVSETQAIDVLSDLNGVEAELYGPRDESVWKGWLPHMDLKVAHDLTAMSAEHRRLFQLANDPGVLALRSQLDLWYMLHPLVQPNVKLSYEYPPETVTVIFRSDSKFDVLTKVKVESEKAGNPANSPLPYEKRITIESKRDEWLPLKVLIATGHGWPKLEVSFITNEDPRERPLALRRFVLPWALSASAQPVTSPTPEIPEIIGGDWQNGKKVFFGEKVGCFKCHQVNGEGGKIGPDLSSLVQRDYASVYKDVTQPSAAINPDHIAYNVETKDGNSLSGVVLSETPESVVLGQVTGASITINRDQITSMKASPISLMPEGLLQQLSAQEQKDLFTFLLTAPSGK